MKIKLTTLVFMISDNLLLKRYAIIQFYHLNKYLFLIIFV